MLSSFITIHFLYCFSGVDYIERNLLSIPQLESAHLPAKTQAVNGKEESTEEQHPSNTATTGKVTLHSLQQKLMVDAKKKKELTQYEVVRQDVIEYLQKVFR